MKTEPERWRQGGREGGAEEEQENGRELLHTRRRIIYINLNNDLSMLPRAKHEKSLNQMLKKLNKTPFV